MEDFFLSSISKQSLRETLFEACKELIVPYVYSIVNDRDETEIITKKDAARFLKVTEKTIEEWTKQGVIPAYRIGYRVRYKKSELKKSLSPIKPI